MENTLTTHPHITHAATTLHHDHHNNKHLIAYTTTSPEHRDTPPEELRSYLAERLPAHMVPSAVVVLDALPLTPSGKLDRARCPRPSGAPKGPVGARRRHRAKRSSVICSPRCWGCPSRARRRGSSHWAGTASCPCSW
ncbi:AMP-binding enzyme [Streptomyces rapamycinicus]|uniref:AMP-binding enzyme n=1 Tax=Streptomyces rapamycinicus TaxID=1226757 RepID=UPI003CCD265C